MRLKYDTNTVLKDLDIVEEDGFTIHTKVSEDVINEDQRVRSYLRGAFLAGGSVNNPETSRYHLEIYSLYEEHNQDIARMMNRFGLNAKTFRRSGTSLI